MLDPLTLDQMRVLVAVADNGSFSAAARKLNRVQSAISQAVQTTEAALGLVLFDRSAKIPTLTEAGAAIVADARGLLASAAALRARAQTIAEGVEAELTISIDAIFPLPLLMEALAALHEAFPKLPVTVFTEELGGAEEQLLAGGARMALYPLRAGPISGLTAEFLTRIVMVPCVASRHPLASAPEPLSREEIDKHVQLVLTGRTQYARNLQGGILSRRLWRFADLNTRLAFLLRGFGWCNMPFHMVESHIAEGRLKRLTIMDEESPEFPIYVVSQKGRELGKAGRWLVDDLRVRLTRCPNHFFAR